MNFKEIMNTVLFEEIGKLLHFSLKVWYNKLKGRKEHFNKSANLTRCNG